MLGVCSHHIELLQNIMFQEVLKSLLQTPLTQLQLQGKKFLHCAVKYTAYADLTEQEKCVQSDMRMK